MAAWGRHAHKSPSSRRGARNMNTPHKKRLKETLLANQDGKCAWCGCELTYDEATFDHVKAVSKGGTNRASNLVIACRDCNHKRGDGSVEVDFGGQPDGATGAGG